VRGRAMGRCAGIAGIAGNDDTADDASIAGTVALLTSLALLVQRSTQSCAAVVGLVC
jgi:hypothetical protein